MFPVTEATLRWQLGHLCRLPHGAETKTLAGGMNQCRDF